MSFAHLGLSQPLLQALLQKGYETPSPIQEQVIPAVLNGKDVLAAAQTGTGKTAGYALPIIEMLIKGSRPAANRIRALILTPTRELAAQVEENIKYYRQHTSLTSHVVFGGVSINPQMQQLRRGTDILVATPGRLLDLYNQNAVKFDQVEMLVLDEADRMLDMGFIHDIKRILKMLPKKRQNLLFSATFSDGIRTLATSLTNNPVEISVTPENSTVEKIEQWLIPVDKSRKIAALTSLIKTNDWRQILVFSRTKHGANRIAEKLSTAGIPSAAIHGNKSQGARTKALAEFKSGKVKVLVATDIAARGIDIDQLPNVVNLDLPNTAADYVHRIGRTGRAGAAGQAVSLVSHDELAQLKDIERLTRQTIRREILQGFETQEIPTDIAKVSRNSSGSQRRPRNQSKSAGNPRSPRRDGRNSEMASGHQRSHNPSRNKLSSSIS